jgi:ribosome-associated translation inhibitor RaiA
MNKRITFRGMDHSQPMEDYANEQLARIEQFLASEKTPQYINLVFMPSHVHAHHHVELHVTTPNYERFVSYEGADFYAVLDRVIDTMYLALHEDKDRHVENRKMQGRHDEFKKQR